MSRDFQMTFDLSLMVQRAVMLLREILTEWVPIRPNLVAAVDGLKPDRDISDYLASLKRLGYDLAWIFEEKPRDFPFPWDGIKVRFSRDEMWPFYARMRARIGQPI